MKKPRHFKPLPSLERLHEVFVLNRRDGTLTWKPRSDKRWNTRYAGKIAGSLNKKSGYHCVLLDSVQYQLHRIIWKMANDREPTEQIDHHDTDQSNNRPRNLREANTSQNKSNGKAYRRKTGIVLPKGVYRQKRYAGFQAAIRFEGKLHYLGSFPTEEAAHAAYCAKAAELNPTFARAA